MRIESIELIGYIGFYNGMGLSQIQIDFTKCINNKIIIKGSNGSGKSTLINALHPYPDSNMSFIPTSEARKTLVLRNNNISYIIRYIHPLQSNGERGTTRGYISKSIDNAPYIELNDSGNITTCKEIIYDEFEFDSAFGSLSTLSSENRGLVDMRPAERKKLINSIMNSLDVYNGIYKNINKKSNTLKSLISNIVNKIDTIGDDNKLMAMCNNIDNHIAELEHDKNINIENIAGVKLKIQSINEFLDSNKYSEINNELNDVSKVVSTFDKLINNTLAEYNIENIDRLKEFYVYLEKQCSTLESQIESLSVQTPVLLTEYDAEYKKLQEKQQQLDSMNSDTNLDNIIENLDLYKHRLQEYERIFSQMGLMNINLITKDEFNAAMESIGNLKQMSALLIAQCSLSDIEYTIKNKRKVLHDINTLQDKRLKLDSLKSQYTDFSKDLAIGLSKREIAQELMNRPAGCKIDDCIYISAALKADKQYPIELIKDLENKIALIQQRIESLQNEIDHVEDLQFIYNEVVAIEHELSMNKKFIMKLPVRNDFIETFLQRMLNNDPFTDIDELYKYIDCGNILEEYKLLQENIKVYEAESALYESKNTIIQSILHDIKSLQEKTDSLISRIDNINAEVNDKREKLSSITTVKDKVNSVLQQYIDVYLPNHVRLQELKQNKTQFQEYEASLTKYTNDLNTLNETLAGTNNDIASLSTEKEHIIHSLLMLSEYKTELGQYQKDANIIEKIKYYSNPSTGIQAIYINMYMNKLLNVANNLLSLLFSGRFLLQPFIITDTEFKIPCIGSSGILYDDITSMSNAERTMISMIISFAILHQSSSIYNIVCLDEIDSMLDEQNRLAFINVLDSIMSILKVEQCFMISHNIELDTSTCDLILLKNDSPNVPYGNVIWHY